jgi:hypothetical protein
MRLIEESDFDASTKGRLATACEVTLRQVVRDQPRQAWNARLLLVIQHAVLDCAATGGTVLMWLLKADGDIERLKI